MNDILIESLDTDADLLKNNCVEILEEKKSKLCVTVVFPPQINDRADES